MTQPGSTPPDRPPRAIDCCLALILAILPTLAQADNEAKPAPHRTKPHAAAPAPRRLSDLGRYVALAPGCKLRDPHWAEQLDVALNQAVMEAGAGADPISGQRELAAAELQAAKEIKQNQSTACRALTGPDAESDLRRADSLVK